MTIRSHDERSLARAEEGVVRRALSRPGELSVGDESILRQAFALARLSIEADPRARQALGEFRRLALATAHALFGEEGEGSAEPQPELLSAAAARLWGLTLAARDATGDPKAWEAELRRRRLVLALGGGGGVGYVYLGCFALLDQWGLAPALIAGTSFGAVLGLFRAQRASFHARDTAETLAGLSLKKLFRLFRVRSQYALPGPLQLYLRSALLPGLEALARKEAAERGLGEAPAPPRLRDLPIPLVVAVAGVRKGMLPRPPKEYERLLDPRSFFPPTPRRLRSRVQDLFSVLGEFVRQPHRLDALILGSDPGTENFDALDSIGFSCSLPGFIHYDVLRDDPAAHRDIRQLFDDRELGWLADGGLVENCPARAAHLAFRAGAGGAPRNGFVLALDAFSPKILSAPWLGLQRLAQETTRRVLPWADCYLPFPRTLSPLSILPSREQIARASLFGRAELSPLMPFLAKMLTPLPALETCRQ